MRFKKNGERAPPLYSPETRAERSERTGDEHHLIGLVRMHPKIPPARHSLTRHRRDVSRFRSRFPELDFAPISRFRSRFPELDFAPISRNRLLVGACSRHRHYSLSTRQSSAAESSENDLFDSNL